MELAWQSHFEAVKTVELAPHASAEKSKTTSYHIRHVLYAEPIRVLCDGVGAGLVQLVL